MEQMRDENEVYLSDSAVFPGYLFDEAKQQYIQRDDGIFFDVQDCPIQYRVKHHNMNVLKNMLKNTVASKSRWMKDLEEEDPTDAIQIKGMKVLEKKAVNFTKHKTHHTVTSIFHKSYVDLFLTFSQNMSSQWIEELLKYISAVVNGSSGETFPSQMLKYSKFAFIYEKGGADEPGKKLSASKYVVDEFCRMLKNSTPSSIPITCCLAKPGTSNVKSYITVYEHKENEVCKMSGVSVDGRPSLSSVHKKSSASNLLQNIPNEMSGVSVDGRTAVSSVVRKSCDKHPSKLSGHGSEQIEDKCSNVKKEQKQWKGQGRSNVITSNITRSKNDTKEAKAIELPQSIGQVNQDAACSIESKTSDVTRTAVKESGTKSVNISSEHNSNLEVKPSGCTVSVHITFPSSVENIVEEKGRNWTVNNSNGSYGHSTNTKAMEVSVHESRPGEPNLRNLHNSQNSTELSNQMTNVKSESCDNSSSNANILAKEVNEVKKGMNFRGSHSDAEMNNCWLTASHNNDNNEANTYPVEKNATIDEKCTATEVNINGRKKVDEESKYNMIRNSDGKLQAKEVNTHNLRSNCGRKNQVSTSKSSGKDEIYSDKNSENKIPKREGQSQTKERNYAHSVNHPLEDQTMLTSKAQQIAIHEVDTVSHPIKSNESNIAVQQLRDNKEIGNPSLLTPVETRTDPCGIRRNYYGQINNALPEKVILLLGASGCGKTTLINFVANYFMGKKTADEELVRVENITVPTAVITAYTFCAKQDENPLTIVDTPGLNDSSGSEIRDHVQSLKTFLANASSKGFEMHAIGFVAQAHLVRLTSSERLVMDYVSTMFGESVSEHLITFVTFADNQDTPPIIEAMTNYGVKFKLSLKFNNSALSNRTSDEVDDLDRAYWRVCWKQWRKCLKTVKDLPALSVKAMKAVQSEVYATTVLESAEKRLRAELHTFLTQCHKKNGISKDMEQLCEQIWQLAAVLHNLKSQKESLSYTMEHVLISYAVDTCKNLSLSPNATIYYLSLAPSGRLVTAGIETILALEHFYKSSKTNSEFNSRSICEWAHCFKCKDDHKLSRIEKSGGFKLFGSDKADCGIYLKCDSCKCPGDVHGASTIKSPLSNSEILKHTRKRLQEVLDSYSLPNFTVSKEKYLICLSQRLGPKYNEFIKEVFSV